MNNKMNKYIIYGDGENYHVVEKVDGVGYFLILNYFTTPCPGGRYKTFLEAHRNIKRLRPKSRILPIVWYPELGNIKDMHIGEIK